jgi:hypothetical protein
MNQDHRDSKSLTASHSMSSALGRPQPPPFPDSSRFEFEGFREGSQGHTEHGRSWQSLSKESRPGNCFTSGLPTPPETRAMTGTSLNQHNSNDVVSKGYYPSKFSYSSHTSNGAEVRPRQHNIDGYNHNNSSTGVQSQFWPVSRERDAGSVGKNSSSSDSTIASYLQIPSSINNSKGSLAEFAAEVGYLLP